MSYSEGSTFGRRVFDGRKAVDAVISFCLESGHVRSKVRKLAYWRLESNISQVALLTILFVFELCCSTHQLSLQTALA